MSLSSTEDALVFSFQDGACQSPHQLLQRDPGDWVGKVGHGGGIPVSIASSRQARQKKIPPIRPLMGGLGSNVHFIKNIFHSRGCVTNLHSCGFEAAARLRWMRFLVSSLVLRLVVSHIHKPASQLSLLVSAAKNTFLSADVNVSLGLWGWRLMIVNKSCLCPDESKLIFLVQWRASWAAVFNFQNNCLWIYFAMIWLDCSRVFRSQKLSGQKGANENTASVQWEMSALSSVRRDG